MMGSGNTGARLMELVQAGATVSFDGLHDVVYPNEATGGCVSTFSSWGSTPTLDIKPEISAPGGPEALKPVFRPTPRPGAGEKGWQAMLDFVRG